MQVILSLNVYVFCTAKPTPSKFISTKQRFAFKNLARIPFIPHVHAIVRYLLNGGYTILYSANERSGTEKVI